MSDQDVGFKPSPPAKDRVPIAVATHAACWAVLIYAMLWIYPAQMRVMRDFGVEVSKPTMLVLQATNLVSKFAWSIPLALVALLALDGLILSRLRREGTWRRAFPAWVILIGLVPLAATFFSSMAVMETLGHLSAQLKGG